MKGARRHAAIHVHISSLASSWYVRSSDPLCGKRSSARAPSHGRPRRASRMDWSRAAIALKRSGCWAARLVVSPRSWSRS